MEGTIPTNGTQAKDVRPVRPRPRKAKPERRIRVLEQPTADTDGLGAVEITVGKEVNRYLVHFIPSDFGFGAVGFEIEKLDTDLKAVEAYHVHLSEQPAECSCTCPGATYKGHCKHLDGLAALRQAGHLKPIAGRHRSAGDFAANDPVAYAEHMEALGDFGRSPFERHVLKCLARPAAGGKPFALPIGIPDDGPDDAA